MDVFEIGSFSNWLFRIESGNHLEVNGNDYQYRKEVLQYYLIDKISDLKPTVTYS
jgi:hypothetical protein